MFSQFCLFIEISKNNTIKKSEQWILSLADHDLMICLLDFAIEIESIRFLCRKKNTNHSFN